MSRIVSGALQGAKAPSRLLLIEMVPVFASSYLGALLGWAGEVGVWE